MFFRLWKAVIPLMPISCELFRVSYHTLAVVCNATCAYCLGLTSHSPQTPLVVILATVGKKLYTWTPNCVPNLSEDPQNRMLIMKSNQVPRDKF